VESARGVGALRGRFRQLRPLKSVSIFRSSGIERIPARWRCLEIFYELGIPIPAKSILIFY
jgi:hypothetical protein